VPGQAGDNPEKEDEDDETAGHNPSDAARSVTLGSLPAPSSHAVGELADTHHPDRSRSTPRLESSAAMPA
jgi:hypothetical protein